MKIFSQSEINPEKEIAKFLKNVLGFAPKNLHFYKIAFLHSSASEQDAVSKFINNERLEYLGDAVLNTVIAEYLFRKFPLHSEGPLTEMRSKIVCRDNLNKLSRKMGLADLVQCEINNKSKSIHGDAFEALIGALFLDKGYDKTKDIISQKILLTFMDLNAVLDEEQNYKSKIINWAQSKNYKIRFENGDQPNPLGRHLIFSKCYINNELIAETDGFTIKKADQAAAKLAWEKFINNNEKK